MQCSKVEPSTNSVVNIYDGLIVTSIVTINIPQTEDDKKKDQQRVTFSGEDDGVDTAIFLKNIVLSQDSRDKTGKRVFEGIEVGIEEVKRMINLQTAAGKGKPLFCVHGFNTEPEEMFKDTVTGSYYQAKHRFETRSNQDGTKFGYYPVPVIWPNSGDYKEDTEACKKIGAGLRALLNGTESMVRKSLLCHSMGNKVLCEAAATVNGIEAKFENIFMVAADIDYDIFHKGPTTTTRMDQSTKKLMAKNIFNMLKKGDNDKPIGKIYVLHSKSDNMLRLSGLVVNSQARLGLLGVKQRKTGFFRYADDDELVVDEYRNYIDNKDCRDFPMEDNFLFKNHSYQFENWAIDFYEEKYV
mmetsp:Transcript_9155/g.10693  ORF Transcript_9155/g.10693 Transcript_9155/m.10693 type:complete len:355 (+) Transcript_9155:65-1129(+)